MTAEPPTNGVDADAAATIDAAARYITGQLPRQRLLQATDPHGWGLARRLALIADTLTGHNDDTATWVEATLPRPRPRPSTPSLIRLSPTEVIPRHANPRYAAPAAPHPGATWGDPTIDPGENPRSAASRTSSGPIPPTADATRVRPDGP
jgi:hypothetical protein